MKKEDLLKQLDMMQDDNVSNYALYENGYKSGVFDALELVQKYFKEQDFEEWLNLEEMTSAYTKCEVGQIEQLKFLIERSQTPKGNMIIDYLLMKFEESKKIQF